MAMFKWELLKAREVLMEPAEEERQKQESLHRRVDDATTRARNIYTYFGAY